MSSPAVSSSTVASSSTTTQDVAISILQAHMNDFGFTRSNEQTDFHDHVARLATPKPFDIVIGKQPIVTAIVAAALMSNEPLLVMDNEFKQEQLNLCKGKRVLVCGSYFSINELINIKCVVKELTIWDFRSGFPLLNTLAQFVVDMDTFNMDKFVAFPRATRLLRRSLEPDHKEHDQDEAFYCGLMQHAATQSWSEDTAIRTWLFNMQDVHENEWAFIENGKTIATDPESKVVADPASKAPCVGDQARITADISKNGSVIVERGALKLRVVVSGCSLADAAKYVDDAAKDVDIGVVVRYDLAKKLTMLTCLTDNETDLTFMEKEPWNGGGRDICKGTVMKRLIALDTLLYLFEHEAALLSKDGEIVEINENAFVNQTLFNEVIAPLFDSAASSK